MMMKPRLWRSTGNAEKYIVSLVFVFNLNGRLARNEDIVSPTAKPHNLSNARHIHRKRIKTTNLHCCVSVIRALPKCQQVQSPNFKSARQGGFGGNFFFSGFVLFLFSNCILSDQKSLLLFSKISVDFWLAASG